MKKGVPSIVQRTLIRPPSSRLGPLTEAERKKVIAQSPVGAQYDKTQDRESAYEILKKRAKEKAELEDQMREQEDSEREERGRPRRSRSGFQLPDFDRDDRPTKKSRSKSSTRRKRSSRSRQTVAEAAMKSAARSIATSLGRALVRGILGSLKKGCKALLSAQPTTGKAVAQS